MGVGFGFILIWGLVLLVVAIFLLMTILKSLRWGFVEVSDGDPIAFSLRKFTAVLVTLTAAAPFVYPFIRDEYRNNLCRAESRVQVLISPEHFDSASSNERFVSDAERIPSGKRVFVAPGLVEYHTRNPRQLGVYEVTKTLRDKTEKALSISTTFESDFGEWIPLGTAPAIECWSHELKYGGLRSQYIARGK